MPSDAIQNPHPCRREGTVLGSLASDSPVPGAVGRFQIPGEERCLEVPGGAWPVELFQVLIVEGRSIG
jgi:hypothetical protein